MKTMRFFIVFLLVQSIFFTTTANAATVGGWSMSNPVAKGASTVYNGTKQVIIDGKDYIKKGTAIVTPTATGVAKVLAKGVAGVALSVAVEQLIGAVDWVLDPANNQIKYTATCEATSTCPTSKFLYSNPWTSDNYSSPSALCGPLQTYYQKMRTDMKLKSWTVEPNLVQGSSVCRYKYEYGGKTYSDLVIGTTIINPNYDPQAEQEQKTIPLEVVAAKVISNAEGNTNKKAGAQVATGAAAADIVAEAEKDNVKARPITQQLEASSSTKPADEAAAAQSNTATGTQTQNPTKPEATDLKLEFPVFCNWAPIVCEAAQTVISFPQTLTNWWETGKSKAEEWATSISESWTAVKEWAKSEEPEDTELDIPEPEQPEIDTDIAFGGQCPADHEAQINMGVGVIKMPISYEPICTTVSTAKPVLIFVGFFIAALIIGGVKTE